MSLKTAGTQAAGFSGWRAEFRALMDLAIPLVVAQIAQNSISFVDTVMVGRINKDAIAGIALGSTTWFLVTFLLSGMLIGLNPIVAQLHGHRDGASRNIAKSLRQGFLLGATMAIPAMLIFWNAEAIFLWLNQPEHVAHQSSLYLRAISWGLLPAFGNMAIRAALEGLSDTRPILVISLLCVGLNVVANEVLMFGHLGFPAMGLVGTGYASAIVMTFAFCTASLWLSFRHADIARQFIKERFDRNAMWELLRVGVPIGMTIGFELAIFSGTAIAMGWFGKDQLAAHHIVIQVASITFMIPLGIAIAMSVRVGTATGRNDRRAMAVAGWVGIATCASVMIVTAIVFIGAPGPIISMFVEPGDPVNDRIVPLAMTFMGVAAFFQIFDGIQVSASNALRGMKDTRAAMLITLVAYWVLGAPIGLLLAFPMGFGPVGLWYGLTIGLAAAAVMLTARFRWHFR